MSTFAFSWLVRQDIGLGALVDEFERRQLYTLGDLAKVYRGDVRSYDELSFCLNLSMPTHDAENSKMVFC